MNTGDTELEIPSWGCVAIIIVALLCFTVYQLADRMLPAKTISTEVQK